MNFVGPYSDLPPELWALPLSRPGRHTDIRKIAPSAGFPISLAEIKADLRVDSDDEDQTIMRMARAAADFLELRTGCAIIGGRYEARFNGWSLCGPWEFQRWPYRELLEIAWHDNSGSPPGWRAVDLGQFWIDPRSRSFLVQPLQTFVPPVISAPFSGIRVRFLAGFDDVPVSGDPQISEADDVEPLPIEAGMQTLLTMLIAHYYENRELFAADKLAQIEAGAGSLLAGYRKFW